ncbi:hypothetical protein H1235_06995 [Pseudoxanthomonas sp. NC8]|nr:hypothetical protein H1235_06995 [Pseudoxanthomonas sp. NC8]
MELRTFAKYRTWYLAVAGAGLGFDCGGAGAGAPGRSAWTGAAGRPYPLPARRERRDRLRPKAGGELQAGRFAPLPSTGATFGFQPGAYWFHVALENRDPAQPHWLLVQNYPLSDRLDLYLRHADGRITHQAGGDHLPFGARSVRYRHPNFMLDLPPGEHVDLLLRVQSQSSMQVPLTLYSPTAFIALSRDAQFGIGIYYGILLALFFYNLVLWLALRDPSYFWYLFHLSAFGLVLLTLNGLGFEYLWPDSPRLADLSVPLSICLSQVGMQQFARVFLRLRGLWPAGDRISLGVIAYFVVPALPPCGCPTASSLRWPRPRCS